MQDSDETIRSLWIGGNLTNLETLSIKSFLAHDHHYELYTYGDVGNIPKGVVVKDGNEILSSKRIFRYGRDAGAGSGSLSGFSNYFRYHLLWAKGGFWVDVDVICLRSFRFETPYVFASEQPKSGIAIATSCVIKSPPRSIFAQYCRNACDRLSPNSLKWGQSGPRLVADAISANSLRDYMMPAKAFCPVHYQKAKSLLSRRAVDLSESYGVHLWNEMWRRNGYKKDGAFHPQSTYEILKRRFL